MFYLYKISFKKYYYIGVTSDFINRKEQHKAGIYDILRCLINDTPPLHRTIPAYRSFAELLLPLVKKSTNLEREILKYYSISVLRRAKTQKEIQELENRYLKKSNKFNLNIRKESYYNREIMIKEKPYVIRGNNKNQMPCVVKITYGNRYVIAKMKLQSAGLKRIEDSVNAFVRGGTNNPDGLYHFLLSYVKRQPQHEFKVKTLLFSESPYELLKKEQEELDAGDGNKNFLNNQKQAYIPQYNEEKEMYGGWIRRIDVLNFNNWLKNRKKKSKATSV